ncbi:Plastid lipid-associated protein 3, chloroplastic [Linum grandiflorum]
MALISTAHSSPFLPKTPIATSPISTHKPPPSTLFFPRNPKQSSRFTSLLSRSSASDSNPKPDQRPTPVTDEWGEKSETEPERLKGAASDPPVNEDEWEMKEEETYTAGAGNGTPSPGAAAATEEEKKKKDDAIEELKRSLADTVFGTDLGFRASSEVRAEVSELVNQLEAVNPTPAPVDATLLLDGNWVLLYTAFSELLPLLAVGGTSPLLKVKKITQSINTNSATIVNSTTLSSPFADFSFSATATFEVRSPSRIQVQFKEGTLQPPDVKSSIDLPDEVNLFGQKISLSPVSQALSPLEEPVAAISRAISGQSPLTVPIPGGRSSSWLITTYLDEDLRISRGDGGLFILAKEGSPLLFL